MKIASLGSARGGALFARRLGFAPRLRIIPHDDGDDRLRGREQQPAVLGALGRAPFEPGRIRFAGFEARGGREGLDPERDSWIRRNAVLTETTKAMRRRELLRRKLGEHGLSSDQHDTRLERLLRSELGVARWIEGLDERDLFGGIASKLYNLKDLADDLLRGADEIAEFNFGDRSHRRKVYYLAECTRLPVFRLGSVLCARKSVLLKGIEGQEGRASGAE